jgi:hypothetical protein
VMSIAQPSALMLTDSVTAFAITFSCIAPHERHTTPTATASWVNGHEKIHGDERAAVRCDRYDQSREG